MGDRQGVLRLVPGDEVALEAFLAPHWQSSMFLRANARAAGLVDRGQRFEGTYMAAWQDDAIVAVAAHFGTGMVAVQVPDARLLPSLVQAAVAASGRRVRGFSGPRDQVAAACAVLGLQDAPPTPPIREDLFALTLADLRLPPRLADGAWHCRAPRPEERDLLAEWRAAYETEGQAAGPDYERVRRQFRIDDSMRVLIVDGQPAAMCTLIGQLPDVVMLGGVFTPPAGRGRHYARAVAAGALHDARARGVAHALLFTVEDNVAARRAYVAIGFTLVAEVTMVVLPCADEKT